MSSFADLHCPDCMGTAVITAGATNGGSTSLHTEAWCAYDLSTLWATPGRREGNLVRPRFPGRRPKTPVDDQREDTIPMVFGGTHSRAGDPYTQAGRESGAGLEANLDWFTDNVVAIPTSGASGGGTRTLTLTKPSGEIVSGPVQVGPMQVGFGPGRLAFVTLRLVLPDGALS